MAWTESGIYGNVLMGNLSVQTTTPGGYPNWVINTNKMYLTTNSDTVLFQDTAANAIYASTWETHDSGANWPATGVAFSGPGLRPRGHRGELDNHRYPADHCPQLQGRERVGSVHDDRDGRVRRPHVCGVADHAAEVHRHLLRRQSVHNQCRDVRDHLVGWDDRHVRACGVTCPRRSPPM